MVYICASMISNANDRPQDDHPGAASRGEEAPHGFV
jgi:hypothetical protein